MYDLTIIGAGPAGVTAGVYAARKRLKTAFITEEWGGQSNTSIDIQNWIGFPHISGTDLANKLEAHLREYADEVVTIFAPERVVAIQKEEDCFTIETKSGEKHTTKALFVATGSRRRRLTIPGADAFENKGLTYCATCDGPLFAGKDIVVIGGGNAGFETAMQLLEYANSVTLFEYGDTFPADAITVENLKKNEKFHAYTNRETLEVIGDNFVTGLRYKDKETGEEKELEVGGIFVEIGMIPNTDIVADLVTLNDRNHIEVDPHTQRTSMDGIWAAGDCTDVHYHQNNIAVGDAIKAIENMHSYLR